jgi:hypothetical protein
MKLNLRQILDALSPLKPPEAIFAGIVLYFIGILVLIGMFMQKEGSTRDTMLLTAVLVVMLIDKIAATSQFRNQVAGFQQWSFGLFIARTLMFTFPLVVAGSTKSEKSRPILIFAGLLGGAYLFARWFFEMRPQA